MLKVIDPLVYFTHSMCKDVPNEKVGGDDADNDIILSFSDY